MLAGVGKCPIHHPTIRDIQYHNLQEILESDVQNLKNETFTIIYQALARVKTYQHYTSLSVLHESL